MIKISWLISFFSFLFIIFSFFLIFFLFNYLLFILGSHHSASCYLKEENEITADQPWCVRVLNSNEIIRKAVYNWSKDQKLTITEQVNLYLSILLFHIIISYY